MAGRLCRSVCDRQCSRAEGGDGAQTLRKMSAGDMSVSLVLRREISEDDALATLGRW